MSRANQLKVTAIGRRHGRPRTGHYEVSFRRVSLTTQLKQRFLTSSDFLALDTFNTFGYNVRPVLAALCRLGHDSSLNNDSSASFIFHSANLFINTIVEHDETGATNTQTGLIYLQ